MPGPKPNTRLNSASNDALTLDDKINLILSDIGQIKNDNKKFLKDINEIKDDLRDFKQDITKSLDMCFSKIEDVDKNVKTNTTSIASCQVQTDDLRGENLLLKREVGNLKKRLAAAEQYSRSNCLEIKGVPEKPGENVILVVKQVAATIGFRLESDMIDAVHRLSINVNKPDDPRSIILKFCRRLDMEEMRTKSRVKNGFSAAELGFESESKIYVNLSLSKEARVLWARILNFRRDAGYKYCWITNAGKMFLRKEEGQRAVNIGDKEDLEKLK